MVHRLRQELGQAQAVRDVPVRFEGLPGEYLQVDWGELRGFGFTQQRSATRYFLACRLKYSRWVWVRWTTDMRQETLFRGLVDCCAALGWVPWVLVFDNMKTVTSGRDAAGAAVWTPALLQLAGEYHFHPQACDPGAPAQKGSVESLVKWVKGSLLPGRSFADDADLAAQTDAWQQEANARPSSATGVPPTQPVGGGGRGRRGAAGGGVGLRPGAAGRRLPGGAGGGARQSLQCAGRARWAPRWWCGCTRRGSGSGGTKPSLADHPRAPDGARQRVVDPAHFAPLFARKPRARVMLYRDALVGLGGCAPAFVSALCRRRRDRIAEEVVAVYALWGAHGTDALLAAMAVAEDAGVCDAAALTLVLAMTAPPAAPPTPLRLPGVPVQQEVDRRLSTYETWVRREAAALVPAQEVG